MKTKTISSTEAQNNFGRVLQSAVQDHTTYIVLRHEVAQVVVMGVDDLAKLLNDVPTRETLGLLLREVAPVYSIGEDFDSGKKTV